MHALYANLRIKHVSFLVVSHLQILLRISRSQHVTLLVISSFPNVLEISRSKHVAFLVTSSFANVVGIFRSKRVTFLVASKFSHCTQEWLFKFPTITILLHNSLHGVITATAHTDSIHILFTASSRESGSLRHCLSWRSGRSTCFQITHPLPWSRRSTFWRDLGFTRH